MAVDSTYSLITLDELEDFLAGEDGDYPTDVSLDPVLEFVIDGVSKWFHEYTHRQLKSREITEYYNGDNTCFLYLNSWPVTASDIRVDYDHTFGDETKITPNIITDNEVYYSGGFINGVRNIKVVYTCGYTTIPADLKYACCIVCQIWLRNQKKGTSGVGQISLAGNSVQLHVEKLASPIVLDILDRYRRVIV